MYGPEGLLILVGDILQEALKDLWVLPEEPLDDLDKLIEQQDLGPQQPHGPNNDGIEMHDPVLGKLG